MGESELCFSIISALVSVSDPAESAIADWCIHHPAKIKPDRVLT